MPRAAAPSDPFALEPTSLPNVPDAPKKDAVKPAAKAKPAAPARPPVDRSKLDAAENALGVHMAGVDAELAGFAGDLGHVLVSCSFERAPLRKDSSKLTAPLGSCGNGDR